MFDQMFTNIFGDGEITGASPDCVGDYYKATDFQQDHLYWQQKMADAIIAMSNEPDKGFFILYGCDVTDGGSGTINVSEGVCIGTDADGNRYLVHIPALSGIAVPSAYKDNRQVWVLAKYDYKLGSSTRNHWNGESYHYQLTDTFYGDPDGLNGTGSYNDMFTDSNPNSSTETACVIGSIKMSSGNVFTDFNPGYRTRLFAPVKHNVDITAAATLYNNTINYVNSLARTTVTLPTSAAVGDIIEIIDVGGGGYQIAQNANQYILFMNKSTVPGTAGYLRSKTGYSSITLVCIVANTAWQAICIRDEYYGKGYIIGGYVSVVVNTIEDLNFSTETSAAITATLDTAKEFCAGVSGSLKGYVMGGQVVSTAATNVIEDLNFSTEASAAITATLDAAKYGGAGVSGALKGYCLGGWISASVNVIEDLNFSTEASAAITATLDTAKTGSTGVSGSLKGYVMGGWTTARVAVIEDLNFSTEASAAIVATLDTAKYYGAGISGSLKGYILGGDIGTTTYTAVIEDLNFSTEASAAITATLDTAKSILAGVSGMLKGYCMGGSTGSSVNVIEDFEFIPESSRVIAATLDAAKRSSSGVQGYIL